MSECRHRKHELIEDIVYIYGIRCIKCGKKKYHNVLMQKVFDDEKAFYMNDKVRQKVDLWHEANEKGVNIRAVA
jgi:hypothetical protein